jgi:AraC-like DNA-binding protein
MARVAGTPERTLRREFTAAVGLPPKVVARIARVRRALAAIAGGQTLSAVASRCGFADQAHMTREFMDLVGKSPRAATPSVAR